MGNVYVSIYSNRLESIIEKTLSHSVTTTNTPMNKKLIKRA